MTNPTPMTPEAAQNKGYPSYGHMVINGHIHPLDNLFLSENGNDVWTWCAIFKIAGKVQSIEGADFPSKSRAMSQALSYGCAPSAHWYERNYPDHEMVAA